MTAHEVHGDREADHLRADAERDEQRWQRTRAIVLLWVGVLLAPLAFLLDLTASFALADHPCGAPDSWLTWIVTGVAALAAGVAVMISLRNWRRVGADPEPQGEGVEHSDPRSTGHTVAAHYRTDGPSAPGRSRFMALAGVALGSFFLVVVIASVIPTLFIHPCS
jgi:hypothetical protein